MVNIFSGSLGDFRTLIKKDEDFFVVIVLNPYLTDFIPQWKKLVEQNGGGEMEEILSRCVLIFIKFRIYHEAKVLIQFMEARTNTFHLVKLWFW